MPIKKCPQCESVYTDETLNFCLTDGTSLIIDDSGEKTLAFNTNPTQETFETNKGTDENLRKTDILEKEIKTETFQTTHKNGANKFWIVSTIFLFSLLLVGGGVFGGLYFGGYFSAKEQNQNTSKKTDNQNKAGTDIGRLTQTNENLKTPEKTPPKKKNYRVVGVAKNDVLYVRPSPGNLKVKVGSIPPGGKGIVVTGKGRRSGKSVWLPINYKGIRGWVNSRYLAKEK